MSVEQAAHVAEYPGLYSRADLSAAAETIVDGIADLAPDEQEYRRFLYSLIRRRVEISYVARRKGKRSISQLLLAPFRRR